jgi:hypothetical protein
MPSISPEMTASPVTRRYSDPEHAYLFATAGIEARGPEASYHSIVTNAGLPGCSIAFSRFSPELRDALLHPIFVASQDWCIITVAT